MAETANGCLVLHSAGTIAERHNREPKNLKKLFTRSSWACQESFFPLDKDLSWMSAIQNNREPDPKRLSCLRPKT